MSDESDYPCLCELCQRSVPRVTAHHLTPKSRGGKETVDACPDCHAMIHALFPNKQLERELDTVDSLTNHPEFAKYLKWISKQRPDRRFRTTRSRKTKRRGRSG